MNLREEIIALIFKEADCRVNGQRAFVSNCDFLADRILALASPASLAGWRVVPVEATEKMVKTALDLWAADPGWSFADFWRAMIEASPPAPLSPPVGGWTDEQVERAQIAHWETLADFKGRERSTREMRIAAMRAALSALSGQQGKES